MGFSRLLFFVVGALIFTSLTAEARFEHERIRRMVVFPFKVDASENDQDLPKLAEDSWWKTREKLTESKRFLVASRNFMQAKDVFQPRGELRPADALILGRLLDANALVTVFLNNRTLNMRVYETVNGLTLWSGQIELHPSIPIAKQFQEATEKLLYEFIGSFPYQGYVIVDPLINKVTYGEGDKILFKADIGLNTQVTAGDNVEVVQVLAQSTDPVFQSGTNIEVYAQGVVVGIDRQIITVQITRKNEKTDIKADSLIRIPDELKRMRDAYGVQDDQTKNLPVEMYKVADDEITEVQKQRKPLVTSLAWIGNLALVLLLAF